MAERSTGAPRWLLVLATGAAPVVLLLALELGLRAAGFGETWPLFVPSPETPGYLQANRDVAKRFAPDPARAPDVTIDTIYFRAQKAENALRLFVQGGSTAAGFPYGRFAGLAGMLGRRVTAALPDREVEVVTTATSAVNSYTLLDFVDEILAQAPDAVLIYAGHNEYLGILGVGSAISSSRSRALTLAFLELRDLRLFQAVPRLRAAARGALGRDSDPGAARETTLMAEVAREKEIPEGSRLYQRGLAQFRANLGALLAAYRRAGVPVYLGTIASNLRQPPFASRPQPGRDAAAQFARAREHEARGEFEAALAAYRRARDLDLLRFRAPEAINAIIRELAAEHGAVLVDAEAALAAASPHGIIGSELMLEHLHPNTRGYFLIGEAFFAALRETGLVDAGGEDTQTAWERQPVTEPDRFAGELRVAFLTAHWPFRSEPVPVELPQPEGRIQELGRRMYAGETSWTEAATEALAIYREEGDAREAARVAVDLAAAFPRAAWPNAVAGQLVAQLGRPQEAVFYFERAVRLGPGNPEILLGLGSALAQVGDVERARRTLDALLELAPTDARAIALRARLADR